MFVIQLENKNQFVIHNENYYYFQSYESLIATYDIITKELTLYKDWNYSKTTLKHLYIFINNYTNADLSNKICNATNKKSKIESLIKKGLIKVN